jgi:ligand-binding sensor domain-containing protein/signal transduction histidine kinase
VFDAQNTALKDANIRSLFETSDGTLWIISERGPLNCFKNGRFVPCPIAVEHQAKVLLETRDKSIWVGTTNGVLRFKNGNYTWLTKSNGLPDNIILAMCEDREGNVWIGTNRGLVKYKDKVEALYHGDYYLPANAVRALFCDDENTLWIGTSGGGAVRLQKGKFDYYKREAGLPDLFVTAIFKDSNGELWVGTQSGLCRLIGDRMVSETDDGTPFETIFCLTEDHEGNLWLGTKEGLSQLRSRPFRSVTKRDGLAHNNATSVCEDRNGLVWIATWGGGVSVLSNGTIFNYSRTNSEVYDLSLSIYEARDGSVWFGADFDGGLFRLKDGAFTHYGREQGLIDLAIRVMTEDRAGNLWIGTSSALYSMHDGNFQRFTTADGLVGNTIRAIHEDQDGNLWIGTNDGLTRRSREKFQTFKTRNGPESPVVSIYEDERNLWVGTDGGGLFRMMNNELRMTNFENSKLQNRNSKFHNYNTRDGLFSDSIFEILEDDGGNLWMSCFSGVFRVRKKDFDDFDRGKIRSISCTSFGKADGMSSVQCNGISKPAGWKGHDGRLWFPTTRGVVVVDPKTLRESRTPPRVVIEEMMADKKIVSESVSQRIDEGSSIHSITDSLTNNFAVLPGRGELEFHYTALSFIAAERSRFRYKLEGVDSDWVDAGTRRLAHYNNIKPGAYAFHVIGCNSDGIWNSTGASVSIYLAPHFWQTTWFLVLTVLATLGLTAGTARYLTWQRVQRRLTRLEQQHAVERERARIARDMHDDLGARLTEVLLVHDQVRKSRNEPQEVERNIGSASRAINEVIDNLHGIVWAVNPRNDTLEKLAGYIFQYVQSFLESGGIRYRFDAPEKFPDCPLSSEVRHNVFMVLKESLNNVAKHAAATEVHVRLAIEEGILRIAIEDNGKGFSVTDRTGAGNGLQNMQKRLANIGGKLLLSSTPGKGTRIELRIPAMVAR